MASSQRPYQGYPYVNPPVIDAPSIDQTTASKWANLPRKQIHITGKKTDKQVIYIELPEDGPGTSAVVEVRNYDQMQQVKYKGIRDLTNPR